MNRRLMQCVGVAVTLVMWCGPMAAAELQEASPKKKSAKAENAAKPTPKAKATEPALEFPPRLPDGAKSVSDSSREFLEPLEPLLDGVSIAKTPPTVDFAYFPGQTYPGRPWSNWGDSSFANGKYYTAIGDHLAPQGNAFVFEYDPKAKSFRQLLDLRKLLALPDGHYTPGKIHSRVDLGQDGWLYCSTHRGSTNATTDANHYEGDWIVRCHPETAKAEIVARGPLGKRCIPNGTLDPQRMIFYGGTAPGNTGDNAEVMFFAYDVRQHKLLYSGSDGPQRYMIFAASTGRIYYTPGLTDGPLMRFDPATDVARIAVKTVSVSGADRVGGRAWSGSGGVARIRGGDVLGSDRPLRLLRSRSSRRR